MQCMQCMQCMSACICMYLHVFFFSFTFYLRIQLTVSPIFSILTGSTLFVDTTVEVNVLDNNEQPAMVAQSMTKTEDDTRFAFRFDLNAGKLIFIYF